MLTLQLTGEIHTSNLRTWNVSAPTVTMLLAPQRQPLPLVLSRPYWSLWPLMTRWVILICCCNDYHSKLTHGKCQNKFESMSFNNFWAYFRPKQPSSTAARRPTSLSSWCWSRQCSSPWHSSANSSTGNTQHSESLTKRRWDNQLWQNYFPSDKLTKQGWLNVN